MKEIRSIVMVISSLCIRMNAYMNIHQMGGSIIVSLNDKMYDNESVCYVNGEQRCCMWKLKRCR